MCRFCSVSLAKTGQVAQLGRVGEQVAYLVSLLFLSQESSKSREIQISSLGPETDASSRGEEGTLPCGVVLAPHNRSSAFLSGGVEFYLFENVGFSLLSLILAYPQNM